MPQKVDFGGYSQKVSLKEKVKKKTNFGPKPWTNPLGKKSIIRLFELIVFIT